MSTITSLGFSLTARTEELEEGLDRGSGKIKEFAKGAVTAMAAVGVAAGAALAVSLVEALDQMDATSTLQAQLGASSKDAAKYGKIAGKLYTDGVTDSFAEGTEAIKQIMQNGLAKPGATNKQLMSIASKATDLAKVFGQEVGPVSVAVAQMIKTGLVKNADQAFDLLAKGFQGGANKADDLLDTMNEYGTQFRKAGLSGEQAMALISQGLQGGARDADIVADSIKEFSIRAVDGSEASAQGFKDLGLNAKTMMAEFGKGGSSANKVLDMTLDRLRNVKDPVKQAAIATALFGTQSEDLGKALFALDPSKATKAMGDVGGAAGKLGETLRSGLRHEITKFYRELNQKVVDFLIAEVIPALLNAFHFFQNNILPIMKDIGSVIRTILVPAFEGLYIAISGIIKWFRDMATWLIPIGILLAGFALSLSLNAIGMGALTLAFTINSMVVRAWAAITRIAAAAQWLFNAALTANPIVLIITLIVAFIAAIVVLYHRSETFRAIISAAWNGIKMVAMTVWNSYLKPLFNQFVAIIKVIGSVAVWLYKNIMQPIWTAIMFVIRINWWIIRVIFALIVAAIKGLAWVAMWLYNAAFKPAFNAIASVVKWLYNVAVKPVFNALGVIFRWLWNNVAKPAWESMKSGLRVLGGVFRFLWTTYVQPAMNAIGSKVRDIWNGWIKPAFNAIKTAVGKVKDAFKTAKDGIGIAWSKLKDAVKAPVKFFVETVYNNGLRAAWNNTAGKIPGVPDMAKASLPRGFAKGGYLGTGKRGPMDKVPILAQAGEYVIRAKRVREIGKSALDWLNRGKGAQASPEGLPGYALGGWIPDPIKSAVGKVTDVAKGGFDWAAGILKSGASAALNTVFKPIRAILNTVSNIAPGGGIVNDLIKNFANAGFDKLISFVKAKATDGEGGNGRGGAKAAAALAWARTQVGKAYQWGGNGNPGWDCSGFVSAIESFLRGQRPHRRWSTHAFGGNNAPDGWVRNLRSAYQVGITNAGVGHTAGTLSGVNVETRGGDGTVVGKKARGATSKMFNGMYGFKPLAYELGGMIPSQRMDSGGTLPRGLSMVNNTTGAPERLERVRSGGGDVHYHFHIDGTIVAGTPRAVEDMLVNGLRSAQDKGRIKKGTVNR